jgi:acyl carrier protein
MLEKIKNIMSAVFEVPVERINEMSSPDTIENWDSLRHINLVTSIEEEFNVRFTDEQIGEMLNLKLVMETLKETVKD